MQTREYARFYFYPTLPGPLYTLRNGKLSFRYSYSGSAVDSSVRINHFITDIFNISGMIGKSYPELLAQCRARGINLPDDISRTVVIDIAMDTLNKAKKTDRSYSQPDHKELFEGPYPRVLGRGNYGWEKKANLEPPVHFRLNEITVTGGIIGIVEWGSRHSHPQEAENTLYNLPGHLEVIDYTNENPALGRDIALCDRSAFREVAYNKRFNDGFRSWNSHLQPNINKDSYHDLTKNKNDQNANTIARLFADYAKKGSGLSSLIYCHMFRHKENIRAANEIVFHLNSAAYRDATPEKIAALLVAQYRNLEKSGHQANPNGSFARRINFALLQLTNGSCQSVEEFEQFTANQAKKPATAATL